MTDWFPRWSAPSGTMDANAPVADGMLIDPSLWATTIIGLVCDAATESIRLDQSAGPGLRRKLREVMDAEIDISDVIQ